MHDYQTYEELYAWRIREMADLTNKHLQQLNHVHDRLMQRVVMLAQQKMKPHFSICPSNFSFFVMGSAGRSELTLWSDQDHGLIYEVNSEEDHSYFKELGQEITYGLEKAGYPLCEGKVMCSNPRWRKSKEDWKKQLLDWVEVASWESIRNLLIFMDGRSIVGDESLLEELKMEVFQLLDHSLLQRMLSNTMRIRNSIGWFGQLIVEQNGPHKGSIFLKEAAFFPYVNALRLLSIKEKIVETSTLRRFERLLQRAPYERDLAQYYYSFQQLLGYRLHNVKQERDSDQVYYLKVNKLNKDQKKEIKEILKGGKALYMYTQHLIEKG